ncbi:MAG: HlyD family efflux transporter periplasmic adaptor subunit [Chloroflexi bacterium]|nr:HlyD family efflux transporter periplasmic adaptor subunit [Chloroflexota bacterium]
MKKGRRFLQISHRARQRKERGWSFFVLLGLGLSGFLLLMGRGEKTAVMAAPAVQNIDIVSAEGKLVPSQQVTLAFQTGGAVAEIFVAGGDVVQAGDLLLGLDAAAAELGVQQAQARLATAESGLIAAENEQALLETAVNTAQAQLNVAQANLALVQAGPQAEQIAAGESRLAAAEAAVTRAIGNRDAALDISDASDILAAEAAVASAQAEVQQLEQAYEDILNGCFDTPQGEICPLYGPVEEMTRQQLTAARLNQEAAQAALEAAQNGATFAQRQAANAVVTVAQANAVIAQAQLDLLLAGATPAQVRLAEVGVQQAQVAVQQAEVGIDQAVALVAQAEAAVSLVATGVEAAQLALERTVLRAPFPGTIITLAPNEGELIAPGLPVVTLAQIGQWQIETADLTELDVALVTEGATVSVQVDAASGVELVGAVTAVALVPTVAHGDVVYKVTIDLLETADLPLRWGMTAFVDIETNGGNE